MAGWEYRTAGIRDGLEKGLTKGSMDKRGIVNKGKIIGICLAVMAASGCGSPSGEKIAKVQGIYADLVGLHNEVVEEYAAVEDDSYSGELDEMAEKIDEIGQRDAQGMTNEELDAAVDEMNGCREKYEEILASIQEMKSGEMEKEVLEVPVTIENNTGVSIYELYLYKASDTDRGENLVGEMGYMSGFQTLNILNLYMTEEETLWHLDAAEESGKVIESVDIDFAGKTEKGATIVMKFSFDSMEGWVEVQ